MTAVIVGAGRVGSAVARALADSGWTVTVVDADEEALDLLGSGWRGRFVVGHGLDVTILEEAGIEGADCVVTATRGDNTNIVVAQLASHRYSVRSVAARIQDPARADFYSGRGFDVVSPTRSAIAELRDWALAQADGS